MSVRSIAIDALREAYRNGWAHALSGDVAYAEAAAKDLLAKLAALPSDKGEAVAWHQRLYLAAMDLVHLVEGPGCVRWNHDGHRFKDTSEWVRFYVEAKKAQDVEKAWTMDKVRAELAAARTGPEWRTIESSPRKKSPMIVVIGHFKDRNYITDPWCVFWQEGRWERWPHKDQPTHWMPLPPQPNAEGVGNG